jgi:ATP-dependent RNA helicase RhlE
MPFKTLRLIEPLVRAVASEGYTIPTDIQKQAIPHLLEGKDLLGCAQTGTGKTAAFALPILQRLHGDGSARPGRADKTFRPIRALILTPTRELAAQIDESFRVYGQNLSLRHTVIFGGVRQGPQTQALHRGVDILVATPGRLLDLHNQRLLSLGSVEVLVLDEADRMLDMGFIHDIRRVVGLVPQRRQTLMFSATMPPEIRSLADTMLHMHKPVYVKVASESPAADTVKQSLYFVDPLAKAALLEHLLKDPKFTRALVFTRTKHGADKVVRKLVRASVAAEAIHSNKSQNARMRALANFKSGKTRVLVASDIAARGLDVDGISHVVNFDLPNVAETYVHRIGRTGRAGAVGEAVSFCSEEQRDDLHEIEKLLGRRIPVLQHSIQAPPAPEHAMREGLGSSHAGTQVGGHAQPKRARPQGGATGQASPTPEKQKESFWRGRARSSSRGGRGRFGRGR